MRQPERTDPIARLLGPGILRRWTYEPEAFVSDVFGVQPDECQREMLKILVPGRKFDRAAMKSAHGVGKSTGHAFVGWNFLITRVDPRVVATAPTKAQLTDALWPEYAKWHGRMIERDYGELAALFDISETHIRMRRKPKSHFAVARTSNRPENLQGFHGKHILIQIDEASAVPGPVFEVIEGALSNAEYEDDEVLLMLTGNPNFTAGEFYDAFGRNRNLYHRFTVTGDKTTKTTEKADGKVFVSPRVTQKYRTVIAAKYGAESAIYDVRVRGVFPRQDDKAVIPLAWAERARYVPLPTLDRFAHPVKLVMDVARAGGAKTTLGAFRGGHLVRLQKWPKTSTPQCVDILKDGLTYWQGMGVDVELIVIDEPGVGGGVLDEAVRRGMPAVGYHGGKPLKEDNGDDEDDRLMFSNRRARDWWSARRLFEREGFSISIEDDALAEELVNELASVHYGYNQQEKIKVESKDDMRARLGDQASPDLADTVIMGLAKVYSTQAAVASMLDQDLELSLSGDDRPTAEAQLDMENLW